jgi:Tfp pilus assembly protein PilF
MYRKNSLPSIDHKTTPLEVHMKHGFRHLALFLFFCCLAGCATGGSEPQRQAKIARQLGEAYLWEQNYSNALSEFLKAERLDPDDHILQQDLGIVYMAKGELEMAVYHFKEALVIKPDYADARNNLGTAYIALKKWDSAIACFKLLTEDLLYETPHFPLTNLGKAYYEKGAYATAAKYYREAIAIEPGFITALFGLGKTYLAMGEVRKAAGALEQAVEAAPDLADAHFELATVYRLLGEETKSKDEYLQVLKLAPGSDLAREAKQELAPMNK